ncbi:FtsX-like permease family protein [Streptomyces sp. NPDC008313]|uniref:FtsX-like permease family protein n=1 Tax=Streptomyces sp. NPDC008313 TaxID=3364826 RepID=UPI0036E92F37
MLLRVRAHRLLLAAALLTVLLTTTVLATLTAYSGAIGDAALRHALREPSNAADTALIVKADVGEGQREAAGRAVREGARRTFDGLPVTVRTLVRSGPYALPRSPRPSTGRASGAADGSAPAGDGAPTDPDLTHFAALDRTQVRVTGGRLPRGTAPGSGEDIEVALPETAAGRLGLRTGTRLALVDRLGGPTVRVRVTGLYRPADVTAPYWRLDDLRGRGVRKVDFTTYGPLLADPAVLAGGRVSAGTSGWLASADFSTLTTGRIDSLRDAARDGTTALHASALSGTTAVTTDLPGVLDRVRRALLVSRSTLLIVALQLVLLAGYALLLVARLLSAERAGETRLLRARGGSRGRVAGLAGLEALLLAVPAALCAPLLAGPLTGLLAGQGALARIGLRPDTSDGRGAVWLVAAGVALGCALAVTLPALTSGSGGGGSGSGAGGRGGIGTGGSGGRDGDGTGGRGRSLPAPVRAGADVGLLVIAAVAYWQLDRRTSGAVSTDASGALGVDPLLVSAPALALLAGTVLTLRLLPPAARLAERRAAGGSGLPAALAGWQLSRRPARGAGPVLLLVLAVAMGTLAIGQGASWDRSQDDQADFAAGTPVRVLTGGEDGLGRAGLYAAVPGVRGVAPAVRTTLPLSGDRTADVLALDTEHAADGVLMRGDLAGKPVRPLLTGLGARTGTAGTRLPRGTERLRAALRIRDDLVDEAGGGEADVVDVDVTLTLVDRYGTPYRVALGHLRADGGTRSMAVDLAGGAEVPAEPLTLTGLRLDLPQPVERARQHRLSVEELSAVDADGKERRLPLAGSWTASSHTDAASAAPGDGARPGRPSVRTGAGKTLTVAYGTGSVPRDAAWQADSLTVRVQVPQPNGPSTAAKPNRGAKPSPSPGAAGSSGAAGPSRTSAPEVTGVATGRFLESAGARKGQWVDVAFGGSTVAVRIVDSVRALPTTGRTADGAGAGSGGQGARQAAGDGGALLVDLPSVNRVLEARYGESVLPTEWWLDTRAGDAARVAAALRARPDVEPSQVLVRDEIADRLRDDPFGAGPQAAFAAAALVAAALAAVGFAVSVAGSLRERGAEFAVLRALGAPRRLLARMIAAEHGVLVALALLVGLALGTVLTRAVVPLIVLTPQAAQPVPAVLVELPLAQVAALLAAVALAPLVVTACLALRRPEAAASLRYQGSE